MEKSNIRFKKLTKQRKYITEILENTTEPVNVETICLEIKSKYNLDLVLSTIYRNLDVLVNERKVLKIFSNDGVSTYIINKSEEHGHKMTCIKCKKQIVLDICPIESYVRRIQEENVFTIKEHSISISGYCKECV
ncbi:MAG: transcriptional repressor [Clostridia bacterium]|nr:transcriptional repressor [Clostridia bacterium]